MREANVVAMATELLQADFEKSIHAPDKKDKIDDLCASCESGDCEMHSFDPDEARDGSGKWTSGGNFLEEFPPKEIKAPLSGTDNAPNGTHGIFNPDTGGRLFHGTGQSSFKLSSGMLYTALNYNETEAFARGQVPGAGRGNSPKTMSLLAKGGKTLDISEAMDNAIMEGEDDTTVLNQAREMGARYAVFTHPSSVDGENDFKVVVSLYPDQDLKSTGGWRWDSNKKIKAGGFDARLEASRKLSRRTEFAGLKISIETDKGETREGVSADGTPWKVTMPWPYGYIRSTVGVDGDHVDCFIGPDPDADEVYVIHQSKDGDPETYDEDKCMLGFASADAAKQAYNDAYSNGGAFYRSMTAMPIAEFKQKVLATKDQGRRTKIHAGETRSAQRMRKLCERRPDLFGGGPGSGRHKESIPVLKEGQRGVGKSDGAVFPVHGPKSNLPGRHFSHGQYTKGSNGWTAPNKKIPGGALTVQRTNNEDGSVKVTRYTTYKQGPKEVTQPSEVLQYPDKQSADAHMMKRFGITAISAREDRIRAFTLDALQCDFDESLHPRDKGGKFASKGESGAQPITPPKKMAQLNQMGFQYKGSHLDENGKVTKDVFEKQGTDHEVHVSKYNTSHPGNADLRKYAVVNKNSGTTIQQGHQISKVQDFVNKNHMPAAQTTAPVQAPAPKAAPAQTPDPWNVAKGGSTSSTEGKALQNAGFTYQSVGSTGATDLWTHPSGAYVKVSDTDGFKVGSANGDETHHGNMVNNDWEGKTVHPAIGQAVADSQAVKNAPTEPVTVPTGKMPADDKISSQGEQQTLTQNGFEFKGNLVGDKTEIWQHPSGVGLDVTDQGYKLSDASGKQIGQGYTIYETIGKLDQPIKDALDNAGKAPAMPPSELTVHEKPQTSLSPEDAAMSKAGFVFVGKGKYGSYVWKDPDGYQILKVKDGGYIQLPGSKKPGPKLDWEGIQELLIKNPASAGSAAGPVIPAPAGVEPNKAGFKQNYYKQEGFVFTGKGPYDADVWKHPSGVTVQVMSTKHNVIMPGEAKKSYQGTPTSWDMKQYVGKAQQTPTQSAAPVAKTSGSLLQPSSVKIFETAGLKLIPGGSSKQELWEHPSGATVLVQKGNAAGLGSIGWNVKDSSGKVVKEAANTGFVKGTQLSPQLLDALNKASAPADHPTKAAGPQVPASGKNNALTGEGYQFQKHENGSDYWTKPGATYGAKITATDATHSGFEVIHNTTGAVHTSGKDAGSMLSALSQVNGPKTSSPQAQQYVPPTPAGPKKDWTENTDKAWQQKARDTVASLWSKAPASAKAYTNNPTGVYNDIAKALGVPFSRLQEVKERIGSWQGGTTAASGGNKIGTWAQDIVNNRDQVHPGLFIEHLVTQERIKEQYGGVVPTLYRGLHSPGDPESAGSGPAKGNIGVLKGLAQMSAEGFHTNFPVYGAEGFSSAKSVSTSFGGSGVVITKAQGNLPSNWIMTSRDINPGMWTGYAGEHEWAVACPEVKDAKTGTMIPKLPIDTEKGDHIQGAGAVNAAMDPEEADNRVFELLSMLKKSGWDYALDGKEITVYPPVGWTNAAWFAEARKPQTAMTASEEKPVRRIMVPGLPPISIEHEMGQTRTGTDKNGRAWSQVMPYAYGRFIGTKGLDGEAVDVILGRNPQSKKVFVACMPKNLGNEEKVMVGFDTIQQAKIAFLACYGYKQQLLQTIGEITKPLLMTLMKVKNGKSALLQQPREVKIAAEADYYEATPGLNVLPTSRPPSLKNHVPVDDPLATDGWRSGDSKKSKKQAREDLVQIMQRTSRQTGNKPTLARTAAMNYQSPYPDVIL